MRETLNAAVMMFALVGDAVLANDRAKSAIDNFPLYDSVEDPVGQRPTRILAENGAIIHFGQAGEERESLLESDLGFPMYFLKVDGGVRVRSLPIVFADGSRNRFDFEDFSCSVVGSYSRVDVLCRNKSDGQLYHSTVVHGGLVKFDMKCFDRLEQVCHYDLIGGQPIRPLKIQED